MYPFQSVCTAAGEGLELVRLFYSLLPLRQKWHERSSAATEFLIDETFRCCTAEHFTGTPVQSPPRCISVQHVKHCNSD